MAKVSTIILYNCQRCLIFKILCWFYFWFSSLFGVCFCKFLAFFFLHCFVVVFVYVQLSTFRITLSLVLQNFHCLVFAYAEMLQFVFAFFCCFWFRFCFGFTICSLISFECVVFFSFLSFFRIVLLLYSVIVSCFFSIVLFFF